MFTDARLLFRLGMFIERNVIEGAIVEQRTFAHRLITSLLVTQITVDFSQSGNMISREPCDLDRRQNFLFICIPVGDSLTLSLSDNPGPVSEDITFTPSQNNTQGLTGKEQTGQTKVVEDSQYQTGQSNVTIIYSEVSVVIRCYLLYQFRITNAERNKDNMSFTFTSRYQRR